MTTRYKIFGDHDKGTLEQLTRCSEAGDAPFAVQCADGHLGYSQGIGQGIAYADYISPSGVGYDIACGNKAVRTDVTFNELIGNYPGGHKNHLPEIADEIQERISFGVGRKNNEPIEHPVLEAIREADVLEQRIMADKAAAQLGTVGAGNHYVDIFADEENRIWIGVHFGSRGFGHKTATGFLNLAAGKKFFDKPGQEDMHAPPTLIKEDTDLGQAYIWAMQLAGEYAYAGRDVVCDKVLEILGATALEEVHNHHNFAWKEKHDGQGVWVIRKGCTPAFPGQRGFVGSSMGDDSVILEGMDSTDSKESLYSTIHGAGRAMSRTKAAGKYVKQFVNNVRDDVKRYSSREEALAAPGATTAKKVKGRTRGGGVVNYETVQQELRERGIVLRGGAADEAPAVYKRLPEVLAEHEGTVKVLHQLKPLIVVMAQPDTFDPYKD